MIDTRSLKEGEVVTVYLAGDESEHIEGIAKCIFTNGVFKNIENNHHKDDIYGSSVAGFLKAKDEEIKLYMECSYFDREILPAQITTAGCDYHGCEGYFIADGEMKTFPLWCPLRRLRKREEKR